MVFKLKFLWIAAVLSILPVGYFLISWYMAKSVLFPDGISPDGEIAWEKEKGFWKEFDLYERDEYEVKGFDDYVLHVELVKATGLSDKYVILTHGYRSNRYGSVKYVDAYQKLGYNCIIYDVRGHGENARSLVTLGNVESKDLEILIEDTYMRYGQDIYLGLHGESMGSSISLSVLARKPKVRFVVADCGFTNLYELLKEGYESKHFGIMIHGVHLIAKWFYGVDLKQTSAVDAIASNTVPIAFIHGADDTFILPKHSKTLYETNPGTAFIEFVEGAGHAQSREVLGTDAYAKWISNVAK